MNNQSDDERGTAARQARKTRWKTLGLSALSGFGGGTPLVKHPDERIAATSQRWAAFSGAFLSITLGIDMFVRIVILKKDFPTEICVIWMVNLLMVSLGQIKSGVPAVGVVGKWSWKTPGLMVAGLALLIPAVVLWLNGGTHSLKAYLGLALLAGASGFVTLIIMRRTYRKWERRNLGPEAGENGDAE